MSRMTPSDALAFSVGVCDSLERMIEQKYLPPEEAAMNAVRLIREKAREAMPHLFEKEAAN